jgi:AraC-like DNA-binding protein
LPPIAASLLRARYKEAVRISTIHARALVDAVAQRGFSRTQLFEEAQLGAALLSNDYAFTSVDQLDALTCAAVRLTNDPAFGLHWAQSSGSLQFDLVSLLIATAPSLRKGLMSVTRIQPVLGDRPELTFSEEDGIAQLRFSPLAVSAECARVRSDLFVAGFVQLLQLMAAGSTERPQLRITFAHARPSYAVEYDSLLQHPIEFEQAFTGISFGPELLDRKLGAPNPALYSELDRQAQVLCERLQTEGSVRARVAQLIRESLPALPGMPQAANVLGVSERSLRRRLAEEGCTYSSLAETIRLELARERLNDATRPLKEIAAELGFSEISAFHRAFKRWTGHTPAEFRALVTTATPALTSESASETSSSRS